jgi:hypothetical protein
VVEVGEPDQVLAATIEPAAALVPEPEAAAPGQVADDRPKPSAASPEEAKLLATAPDQAFGAASLLETTLEVGEEPAVTPAADTGAEAPGSLAGGGGGGDGSEAGHPSPFPDERTMVDEATSSAGIEAAPEEAEEAAPDSGDATGDAADPAPTSSGAAAGGKEAVQLPPLPEDGRYDPLVLGGKWPRLGSAERARLGAAIEAVMTLAAAEPFLDRPKVPRGRGGRPGQYGAGCGPSLNTGAKARATDARIRGTASTSSGGPGP